MVPSEVLATTTGREITPAERALIAEIRASTTPEQGEWLANGFENPDIMGAEIPHNPRAQRAVDALSAIRHARRDSLARVAIAPPIPVFVPASVVLVSHLSVEGAQAVVWRRPNQNPQDVVEIGVDATLEQFHEAVNALIRLRQRDGDTAQVAEHIAIRTSPSAFAESHNLMTDRVNLFEARQSTPSEVKPFGVVKNRRILINPVKRRPAQ